MKFDFKRAAAKTGGLAVGAIAADKVGGMLPSSMNPKVKAAGLLVAGAAVSAFSDDKGKLSSKTLIGSIGDGIVAISAINLVRAFTGASVEGIGADDVYPEAGYVSDPSVSGDDDDDVNGIGDDDDDINGLDSEPSVYGLGADVARIL